MNPPPPAPRCCCWDELRRRHHHRGSVGQRPPGTLINGPAWVAGQASYGPALAFDGVNDELAVTDPSTFNFGTQDFTIELGPTQRPGRAQRHLFSKCANATSTAGYKEFYFKASNLLTFGAFATGVLRARSPIRTGTTTR